MNIKRLFQILLAVVVVFLALLAFRSIMRPEKFKAVYELRKTEIANRLTTLRAVEAIYKNENKVYTDNIDTLVEFANHGFVTIVKNVGDLPEGMTEAEALKTGVLKKETHHVSAMSKILESEPKASIESLKNFQFIPETNGKKYTIVLDSIQSKTYVIPVYRIEVPLDDVLSNMDKSITPTNAGSVKKFWNYIIYNGLPLKIKIIYYIKE